MNDTIKITSASRDFDQAGHLSYVAIGDMCYAMLGSQNDRLIEHYMQKMYRKNKNRFSYEHTLQATINDKVAGLMTCMPYRDLERSLVSTVIQIALLKHIFVFPHILNYYQSILSLIRMQEGEDDEYHVSMLSVSSEFQRRGVGQALLEEAEHKAKAAGFNKISLTVNQINYKANALYQKLGYEKVGEAKASMITLNRMRKHLT
ncbi:GNAT family N-acetyltransferase [Staphylococcus simulans]|uniref:GNAT family N-acetyltransferase n=1 Tax=Staphylococcus simulans TaxID=1286 RepID=UPI000D1F3219|nr:GNAT family N-acetyltransferase [Staphylococcus simulans]PTJ35231.1 N-acetyltransferase [Staphylococcus simulans]